MFVPLARRRFQATFRLSNRAECECRSACLTMTSSGIDIGSNEEEFWVWLKTPMPGQPPAVLFAKHDQYENSQAKQMLPIEPAWVIDLAGTCLFRPHGPSTPGPFQRPDGNLEIQVTLSDEFWRDDQINHR